jgi:serine/threonine protein phosphatase PrpC
VIRFDDIECASLSDVGIRRSHNQDAHVTLPANDPEQWQSRGHIFVVADGMGAHAVGELASKLAVDSIPHIYSKHAHEGPIQALRKAFIEANLGIHTRGQQNREFAGMGTTGTALLLRPEGAWIGHVGDSRCYRIRAGKIQQLTFDHSLLWELARRQNKAPEELVGVPSNVIVRSLGSAETVQVDVEGPHPLEPGDYYVLCSDGLSGQVSDREIGAVIGHLPPAEASRFLINLANLQGGPDNITVIIAHVAGQPGAESANGAAEMPMPAAPRPTLASRLKPVVKRLPWPLVSIFLGISLAVIAIYLIAFKKPGDLVTFIAAAVALLSGVAGLMVQNKRETGPPSPAEPPPTPRIYRETACGVELPVVQRLVHAVEELDGRIKEKNWQIDRTVCQDCRDKGRLLQDRGDLAGAFREDCRAMLMLMEAISKQRNKEESFMPLWDKPPLSSSLGRQR